MGAVTVCIPVSVAANIRLLGPERQLQALVIGVNEMADGWAFKTERDGTSILD
jgi:hypothetical protein